MNPRKCDVKDNGMNMRIISHLWIVIDCLPMGILAVIALMLSCDGCHGELASFSLVAGRWGRFGKRKTKGQDDPDEEPESADGRKQDAERNDGGPAASDEPMDMNQYVSHLLSQGRFMLLLRPQITDNLSNSQLADAMEAMQKTMALVPQGDVLMSQPVFGAESGESVSSGLVVPVQALFFDRYPVTNHQFKTFVDAGGYTDSSLWDPSVLTAVLEFVDQSGEPGPRYWRNGTFSRELADHPVTGISWYEASAFARWIGKRLPTDPEWVKAASWPVTTSASQHPHQRKYPWGNSMEETHANLWACGHGATVAVNEYDEGVSVGGVYQLIGNVWEWTCGKYGSWHPNSEKLEAADGMKSLRGGAFDTYFDSHAVCQFQSGDTPMARKHNVGFRCAIGINDLSPAVMQMAN